jgi:hypothetical protein
VELYETKSRIAEALVESIFRRARYRLRPYRADKVSPVRFGREDFCPNFHAITGEGDATREVLIEVKYRPFIEQFMSLENQRNGSSIMRLARRYWPDLTFVLVTDHPDTGRSCFQLIQPPVEHEPLTTIDLVGRTELRIFQHNVEDHETLLRRIYALLSGEAVTGVLRT